jgi:hypothetical protein
VIRAAGIFTLSLLAMALGSGSARALSLEQVGGSFEAPTYVTSDPGHANRLFVAERKGQIKLVEKGVVSTFADLESEVGCCEIERGLLSIALAPDFDSSGRLFVAYTGKGEPGGEIHVAELTASGDEAPLSSLRQVLDPIPHPTSLNHYGGQLQFGPEGDLFISTGDGGGSNDEHQNAQDLDSLLGKILRIDPDQSGALPYTVPPGNPFAGEAGRRGEIWSYGLRNPYRFSFDSRRGDMVIGDVGQGLREEIDFAPSADGAAGGAGADYGWNCREGLLPGTATDPQCATPPAGGFVAPVFDYPHSPDPDLGGPGRCAVIGGYVVRNEALGALYGNYVYADLCSGAIRAQRLPAGAGGESSGDCSLGLTVNHPVSFGEDAAKRLYVVEEGGRVYRLSGQPPAQCPVVPPGPAAGPPPPGAQPAAPTFIGIQAQRRRVQRGKMALLTVFVSPCSGRKGGSVTLLRNGHPHGSKFLSRACNARFSVRIRRGTTFSALTHEERGYLPGFSRKLTIRLAHRHRRH